MKLFIYHADIEQVRGSALTPQDLFVQSNFLPSESAGKISAKLITNHISVPLLTALSFSIETEETQSTNVPTLQSQMLSSEWEPVVKSTDLTWTGGNFLVGFRDE